MSDQLPPDARLDQALDAINRELSAQMVGTPVEARQETEVSWAAVRRRLVDASVTGDARWRGRYRVWRQAATAAALSLVMGFVILHIQPWPRLTGRTYETAPGQRQRIALADGTTITLGPATRVQVAPSYASGDRRLTLVGEAYFSVVHDEGHPFAVGVGAATVRDIGTAFAIRAYPEDSAIRLAVTAGAASLQARNGEPPATLHAGDIANLSGQTMTLQRQVNVSALTEWMQGGLTFDETPLRDVVLEVSRVFGVNVTLADTAMGHIPVTAAFTGQPLNVVLDAVTRAVGARYERQSQGLVIRRDTPAFVPPAPGNPHLLITAGGDHS